jgi:hypothetical protein
MADQQYEFSLAETSTLDDLTAWMRISAVGSFGLGAFDLISGAYSMTKVVTIPVVLTLLAGVAWILIGIWLWGAATAMKKVTMTEGSDITHFLAAIKQMQKVYGLQALFVGLNALLVFAVLIV